ncbi:MAG: metallophosphoesterase [Butyrivibrio sp.]|nr:metallophosphoesterase [Butyrivibrio sp.]
MHIIIIITIVLVLLLAVGLLLNYRDIHRFVVREYEVISEKVSRDITFVLLTDLHGYVYGIDNDKLIEKIYEIDPDYILCAGDMFIAREVKGELHTQAGFNLLKNLAKKYPIFISNGNHEEKIKSFREKFGNYFDRYKDSLTRLGVHYLENESFVLADENVRISGLELPLETFTKVIRYKMPEGAIEKKLGKIGQSDRDKFQILIAHNPVFFEEYAQWGADLTVSGHVHGGIIRLPLLGGVISPALTLFPKYDGGKYERDNKTMILSCGLGTHTIHVRLFNPGEVSVIRVKRAQTR